MGWAEHYVNSPGDVTDDGAHTFEITIVITFVALVLNVDL